MAICRAVTGEAALRVLQERKVRPLGGNRDVISMCGISATHRDLPKAMARGEFREFVLPAECCEPENSGAGGRTEGYSAAG